MSMVETDEMEKKIAARIDSNEARDIRVTVGGVAFRDVNQVMEFAKMMAIGGITVRKHLRGNPGACLAIIIQALEWGFSAYAVANKSYSVNDQLSYEAQLIEAVILKRAPIKGRPKTEYTGEGVNRKLRVWAELKDEPGEIVEYTSPKFADIQPKNSPLWKNDPDQQLHYYSVRAWCRRHFPDVILGTYAMDEVLDAPAAPRDVTPAPKGLSAKLDMLASPTEAAASHDPETGEIVPDKDIHEDESIDGDPAEAQEEASDHESSAAPSLRDATLTKLRAAATNGKKKLRLVNGGLTPAERAVLTDEDWHSLNDMAEKVG
jgi:hypothetical protein